MNTPAPQDSILMRDGYDARLLLSYGRLPRSIPRSIQVLELGCSTAGSAGASAWLLLGGLALARRGQRQP